MRRRRHLVLHQFARKLSLQFDRSFLSEGGLSARFAHLVDWVHILGLFCVNVHLLADVQPHDEFDRTEACLGPWLPV